MAVITPPFALSGAGVEHTPQAFRGALLAVTGQPVDTFAGGVAATGNGHGLSYPGALAVSERSGTPNMSVDVAKGAALITGTSSLAQGVYAFINDAVVNLPIGVADGSNPRDDLIVAQIREDAEDSSGSNDARLAVIAGTPAASPSDPVVPAGCLVLARVRVGAAVSAITNANVTMLAQQRTLMNPPRTQSNISPAAPWSGTFYTLRSGLWVSMVMSLTRTVGTINGPATLGTVASGFRPTYGAVQLAAAYQVSTTAGTAIAATAYIDVATSGEVRHMTRLENAVAIRATATWYAGS